MKAYSLDLRERIVRAVAAGAPRAEVARRFAVGVATVGRYVRQQRATGRLAPRPRPGRPATIGPADFPALRAQVAAAPDATLAEHSARWARTHATAPSASAMGRTLRRLDLPLKKSP